MSEKNIINLVILNAWIFFILKEFSVDAKYDKVLLDSYDKSATYNIVYLVRVVSLRHVKLSGRQWMLFGLPVGLY